MEYRALPNGKVTLVPPMSEERIREVEKQLGHTLPKFYRTLLSRFGHGRIAGPERIADPLEILAAYEFHFENPADLFTKYFPFGSDESDQTIWLIDMDTQLIATIWHETHPDDYPEEDWLSAGAWLKAELNIEPL